VTIRTFLSHTHRIAKTARPLATLLALITLTVGMTTLVVAATVSLTSTEPENGTISGKASVVNDATASGGKAIQFGANVTGGGTCAKPKRVVTTSDVANSLNSGYPAGTQLYVPEGPDPWGGCFPGPSNTGIPAGTTLSAYTGPCSINTANTVITAKTVNCDLTINASGVQITNSKITAGNINVDSGSLTMTDSEVNLGNDPVDEGLKGSNITLLRVNMYGGKRQVWCTHCTVKDSYLHDQLSDPTGNTHESAVRVDQYTTLIHNSLLCNAPIFPPDAGCSANQTGYPDFEPTHDNTMDKNYYMSTPSGYCSYGGGTNGKPYSNDPLNATNIHFTNNVFERGTSPNDRTTISQTDKRRYTCGYYGATSDFISTKSGFIFSGNMWDDGLLFDDDTTYPYMFTD